MAFQHKQKVCQQGCYAACGNAQLVSQASFKRIFAQTKHKVCATFSLLGAIAKPSLKQFLLHCVNAFFHILICIYGRDEPAFSDLYSSFVKCDLLALSSLQLPSL